MPTPYDSEEVPDGISPLIGYRGWMVKDGALHSCYRMVEWPAGGPLHSECIRPMAKGRDERDTVLTLPPKHYWSPHLECTCGIYALHEYPALWTEFEGERRHPSTPWQSEAITGIVKGWGKIITGTKGFRAQYVEPIGLISRRRGNRWPEVIEQLANRYGLEVVDIKEVRKG